MQHRHDLSPIYQITGNWKARYEDNLGYVMCRATNQAGSLVFNSTKLNIKFEPKIRLDTSSEIRIFENDTLDLKCNVLANPPAKVKWIINKGQGIIDSPEFVTIVKRNMDGMLTCRATNKIGSRDKSIQLIVLKDPVIYLKNKYEIQEGLYFRLKCNVTGVPRPNTIHWYRLSRLNRHQRKRISTDATLEFPNIQRSLDGEYICKAKNSQNPSMGVGKYGHKRFGETEKRIRLIVTYKPGIPKILSEKVISIKKDDELVMRCITNFKNPGIPSPHIYWINDNSKKIISNSSTHKVARSSPRDSGNYRCIVKNSIGSTKAKHAVIVTVNEPPELADYQPRIGNPQIIKYLSISTIRKVNYKCVFRGYPVPTIKWYYRKMSMVNRNHQIIELSPYAHNNWYTINTKSESLRGIPQISSQLIVQLTDVSEMELKAGSMGVSGKYQCQATNLVGKSFHDYYLLIKYAPFIRPSRHHGKIAASLRETEPIKIHCQIESFDSKSRISWKFKDPSMNRPFSSTITESDRYRIITRTHQRYDPTTSMPKPEIKSSELTISQLKATDFGYYECLAINGQGKSTKTFQVVAKSKPEPPSNVKLLDITWDTMTIQWHAGFNGGYEQSFQIHLFSPWIQTQNMLYKTNKKLSRKDNIFKLEIIGLIPNNNYSLRISAVNKEGNSKPSEPAVMCHTKKLMIFEHFQAKILSDATGILIKLPTNQNPKQSPYYTKDICIRLELSRNSGKNWFVIRSLYMNSGSNGNWIGKNGCLIKKVASNTSLSMLFPLATVNKRGNSIVKADSNVMFSFSEIKMGIVRLRLSLCLAQRTAVCSEDKVLAIPEGMGLMTHTVILIIAGVCFLLIAILIVLFVVCCIKMQYPCKLIYRSSNTESSQYSPICCCCCYSSNNNSAHYNGDLAKSRKNQYYVQSTQPFLNDCDVNKFGSHSFTGYTTDTALVYTGPTALLTSSSVHTTNDAQGDGAGSSSPMGSVSSNLSHPHHHQRYSKPLEDNIDTNRSHFLLYNNSQVTDPKNNTSPLNKITDPNNNPLLINPNRPGIVPPHRHINPSAVITTANNCNSSGSVASTRTTTSTDPSFICQHPPQPQQPFFLYNSSTSSPQHHNTIPLQSLPYNKTYTPPLGVQFNIINPSSQIHPPPHQFSPSSLEASSSYSQSSGGSGSRHTVNTINHHNNNNNSNIVYKNNNSSHNLVKFQPKQDNIMMVSQKNDRTQMPDVTTEAIQYLGPTNPDHLLEANV